MKIATIALAVAALIGVAAPASAASLICAVETPRGSRTTYMITSYRGQTWQEVAVVRDGAKLTHASDARPLWKARLVNGDLFVTYLPDPSYELYTYGTGEVSGSMDMHKAHLLRNGSIIATGGCGMPVGDTRSSRPAATTGGRRVQTF